MRVTPPAEKSGIGEAWAWLFTCRFLGHDAPQPRLDKRGHLYVVCPRCGKELK